MIEELSPVDEHECTDAAPRDQPRAHDRLAECGGGRKHSGVVSQERVRRNLLITTQLPLEGQIQRATGVAFVANSRANAEVCEREAHLVETAPWNTNVMGVVLGAGDDARLVVRRQPHRLRLVELRILECRQPEQAVPQPGVEPILADIDLVTEDQLQR